MTIKNAKLRRPKARKLPRPRPPSDLEMMLSPAKVENPASLSNSSSQGFIRPPDVTRQACIVAAFGATGTGKSTYLKSLLAGAPRPVLVFDPKHEYGHSGMFTQSEVEFYGWLNPSMLNGAAAPLVFRSSFDADARDRQFNRWCAAALAVARALGRCTVFVDELHTVTDAGKAPRYWRELIETGRALGVRIYCASIRPAAIDKSLFTNATLIRTGRLNFESDQKTVANVLGVPWRDVGALVADGKRCEFIERDLLTGETRRGQHVF